MAITRKQFAIVGGGATATFLFGGMVKAMGGTDELVRPPFVADEADFLAKCIRCNRCISACPTGAVAPATVDDGFINVKTPKMNFHLGECTFCDECVKVCPTAAIERADPDNPSAGRMGIAMIVPSRCLAYYEGCEKCYEECPYKAIALDDHNRPIVDDSMCNGCGMCEKICPALVLRTFKGGFMRGVFIAPNVEAGLKKLNEVEAQDA